MAIRGPLMLIFSFIMGFAMGGRLAMIFLVTIPLLGVGLALVIRKATPIFRRVFRKYEPSRLGAGERTGHACGQELRPRGL